MTGLFVPEEFLVDQGSVGVNFIELSVGRSASVRSWRRVATYLRTIFSLPLSSVGLPFDLAMRISAPSAVSD